MRGTKRNVTTSIDPDLCSGCGRCIDVCPSDTLSIHNGKAVVTGTRSLSCGHCMAICPESAITVSALDESMLDFSTFELDRNWLPHGAYDMSSLARLMASRRSCRNFREQPVPGPLLLDLVRLGALAPSGTNAQAWTYTIVPSRERVVSLALEIGCFFANLNLKAENTFLRLLLRVFGKNELEIYAKEYYETVKEAISQMKESGKDRLFHGAPALIIVGSRPDAPCPGEDAMLAAGNILLGAHAAGLGTCLIGFAVEAMKRQKRLKESAGMERSETVHAVIALGYPRERYLRVTGRKPFIPRIL